MIFSVSRQKSLNFCLFLVAACLLSTGTVSAQTVGPGCDPAFMKAIQDKAWMEAQREIMIAQTTIAKPDSVFSLGCFGGMTSGFKVGFGTGTNDFDYGKSIDDGLKSGFNHSHGGGHYGTGSNSDTSKCDSMSKLWDAARSADLPSDSKLLGTVKDISKYDRGAFPTPKTPVGFDGPIKTIYDPKTAGKSVGSGFDDMSLFTKVTAPLSLAGGTCADGIPTGISIGVSGGARPEIVCPNPGCVSDGTSTPKCKPY